MKKMLTAMLSLSLATGVLFVTAGAGPYSPPANANYQAGSITFYLYNNPPAKMCKGDHAVLVVAYIQKNWDNPVELGATTNAGTLSKSLWSFPNGSVLTAVVTLLTAKNVGKNSVTFATSETGDTIDIEIEVQDCAYELNLNAIEVKRDSLVDWTMMLIGWARISTEPSVSGKGMYQPRFSGWISDEDLQSGSKGLKCELQGTSESIGNFDVTGSKNKDIINLNIQFQETNFGEGVALYCEDVSGVMGEGVTPIFESKSVNPADFVDVNPKFSKGVSTYTFQFGESGTGKYTLVKRNKK